MAGPIPPPSTSASTLNLTANHTKIIFNLACEGRHLKERVTREFVRLSSGEVLFRTQAQSTSHETLASAHPNHFSTLYQTLRSDEEPSDARNKAMEEIVDAANKAWSRANETLFDHVLDYERKLNAFLDKVGGWIREQEERVWTTVFQIVEDTGTPVCAFLDILFRLLDTLPSLPPNLSYQSQSPLTCGFSPAAYAQPWLGLHNLNLPHAPSFDGGRKAEDVLKDAIIRSTRGRPVSKARVIPAASTSTAPVHVSKTPRQFHREVFLLAPHLQYALPPSANALDPPLHSDRNLAPPPPQARARHQDADPGEAAQVHRVRRDRVPGLAVAAGPGVGPRLGPKPVRVLNQFARPQRQSEALRFSLGIKQVRASMTCHTPPTRQMCPRGAYLCSTFQPLMMMKLANAKRVNMRAEVTRLMPHGKRSRLVMALRA